MANDNQTFFSLGSEFDDTNLPSTSRISNNDLSSNVTFENAADLETANEVAAADSNANSNSNSNSDSDLDLLDAQSNAQLLQSLQILVNNEKLAPDLLPCCPEKIDAICQIVQEQKDKIKKINRVTGLGKATSLRPTAAGSSSSSAVTDESINSTITAILTMEISRIEYLLKSYLRARLAKIEKHAVHYKWVIEELAKIADGDEDNLTEEQKDFFQRFDDSEGKFLEEAANNDLQLHCNQVSRHIPDELADWKSQTYLAKKWPQPNDKAFCFARVVGSVQGSGEIPIPELEITDPTTETVMMQPAVRGNVYLLPFKSINRRLNDDIVLM